MAAHTGLLMCLRAVMVANKQVVNKQKAGAMVFLHRPRLGIAVALYAAGPVVAWL